jgi:hypothetical protein
MELINLTPLTIRIATQDKTKFIEIKPSGKIIQRATTSLLPTKLQMNDFEFLLYRSVEDGAILVSMNGTKEEPFPEMQDDTYYIVPSDVKREKELRNRTDVMTYWDYKMNSAKNTIICYSFYS